MEEITEQQDLDSAKRPRALAAIEAEKGIDAIQEIRTHHGNFINHQGIKLPIQRGVTHTLPPHLLDGDVGAEAKKTMNGLPLDLDRRNPRRRQDGEFFGGGRTEIVQQRGFPGARPARHKDRIPCLF